MIVWYKAGSINFVDEREETCEAGTAEEMANLKDSSSPNAIENGEYLWAEPKIAPICK